ncbi:MAG: 3-demethylubiquinone-9 3-O-methyltransferase [Acidobacteria bacterium]|nr:3-demethylubiquinone-9 3-O-methyltransferase [Acidobacteriota bacterium]
MEGSKTNKVNNELYHSLGERWYHAKDDPVALLRAERRLLVPWAIESIAQKGFALGSGILDVGCGAGLFSNPLSSKGYDVTAFDVSTESLEIAKQYDTTKKVKYLFADAYNFPFPDNSFDIVCAMDFLEHVDKPEVVISEVSRVLKPNGLFFFSTFSRNLLAWLIVIKGVEWFVKNTPKNLHTLELFIKPEVLNGILKNYNLTLDKLLGIRPCFFTKAFFQMLLTGTVADNFSFTFTKSLLIGYGGIAIKSQ